ncbi:MAG: MBL fold metallo-hydrolase [Lachnospiraceae bacterium]|jgi:competence protein ComEC|nr:MBL fold metallo-hydrolase [Lachnospiraceae bacterium]
MEQKKETILAKAPGRSNFKKSLQLDHCLRIAGQMFLLFLLVIFVSGCGNFLDSGSLGAGNRGEITEGGSGDTGTLEVHYLDVGQGDATLIRQGSHAMLIDGGDNDKGTAVQSYLQSQGIEHLEYVIGTHPDSDHVGGLDVVLYKFSWDQVIMPDLQKDTKTYQDVLKVIKDKKEHVTYPVVGDTYSLGNAEFTIIAPVEDNYGDNWNDYSVGIVLSFGENRFIFTGDAEEDAEHDMLEKGIDLSADVMKAAHHGSDTANTADFLEEVKPESVVISCGEGNSYGHPRAGAMNQFRSIGAKVYRTDEQGTIVAVSDGSEITWNCAPSESWKAGEPQGGGKKSKDNDKKQETNETESDSEAGYVINSSTEKFHLPSCSSVNQMKKEHRKNSTSSRQELVEAGYKPCGNCNP